MNVLDSSLEPLAFNYLSFGFLAVVNNLWTWVAVVTAAVSFWRIRAMGCLRPGLPPLIRSDPSSNGPDPVPEATTSETVDERPHEAVVPSTMRPVVGNGDADGVTKGKFTVYYYEDGSQCESDTSRVAEEWEEKENRSDGGEPEWWESWEKLLRVRMGERQWYMHQDLTELNGNVVKFWEAPFGSFARESQYSCSCMIW